MVIRERIYKTFPEFQAMKKERNKKDNAKRYDQKKKDRKQGKRFGFSAGKAGSALFALLISFSLLAQPCNDNSDCSDRNCFIPYCYNGRCATVPCQQFEVAYDDSTCLRTYTGICGGNRLCRYTESCCCIINRMNQEQLARYIEEKHDEMQAEWQAGQDSARRIGREAVNRMRLD